MENKITTDVRIEIEGSLNTRGNSSEVDENAGADVKERKLPKVITLVLQSTWLFVCIVSLFIATLSTKTLFSNLMVMGMDLWKWLAFILIICCTPLLVAWYVRVVVFLIEMNFVMTEKKKKVMYFVYGIKSTVVSFLCSSSLLLAWIMLNIDRDVKGISLIHLITSTLSTFVFGASMWMFKIVILNILSCSFHDKKFFDKIQFLIFCQYVLQILLRGPSLTFVSVKRAGISTNSIGVQLKWIKEALVTMLGGKRLFSICDALDKIFDDETLMENDTESIVSRIFKNLTKNNLREIHESDLLQLMKREHIPNVLKLFEGAFETKRITETSLKDWTMKVCNERKTLIHLLNDTNTAIKELNNIVSLILLISISIIWLVLMGFVTNKVLLSILSTLLLVVFTFGNTNSTICEGIMFVFVRHPFNKGDFCLIDNEQMVVEEIRIITTVFSRENNDKMDYPNSNLATKTITNHTRSSQMSDTVELFVNSATSIEDNATLKVKLNEFLESKSEIQFEEIVDGKVKFGLHATHTINFQRCMNKDKLVFELKKLFEELDIKYLSVQ